MITITIPKVWIIYTLMMGYPVPLPNSPEFRNFTACYVYLVTKHPTSSFQFVCAER